MNIKLLYLGRKSGTSRLTDDLGVPKVRNDLAESDDDQLIKSDSGNIISVCA